jgi:hypothetical protein
LGFYVVGTAGGGFDIFGKGAVGLALGHESVGVVDAGFGVAGIEGEGFLVIDDGVVDFVFAHEEHSQAVHRDRKLRLQLQGLGEFGLGGGEIVVVFLDDAPLEVGEGLIGGEFIEL